jgi:hypothetical protein
LQVAVGLRYGSGLPVELGGEVDPARMIREWWRG